MDSLSQAALGAAVGCAVMGRQIGPRAMLWGAAIATVPDLDIFVPLGSDVDDFTKHRSASHSLLMHLLAAPAFAWIVGHVQPASYPFRFRRWLLAILSLVTHALLDGLTVYGTQLLWPLPLAPTTWSTLFIIDPTYTLPLLVGLAGSLLARRKRWRWNNWGLAVSSVYLLFTIAAKIHVDGVATATLRELGAGNRFISMAAPFNAFLWRLVAVDGEVYREGYYSLFDSGNNVRFTTYPANHHLLDEIADDAAVRRLRWFTKGFYRVRREGTKVNIQDLRMGFEPTYVFGFTVGEVRDGRVVAVANRRLEQGPDLLTAGWFWNRIWDQELVPSHLQTTREIRPDSRGSDEREQK